ncbi:MULTISPECIES: NAD-dependent epimerase/dehydratase family protein [unclassified Crossiella]|uniref:NAD-dependent epimerase/dehydratase family protein n=1 Tax=unclassified Crossiella TaxID=2620835 RepID=UPI002000452D|nr:MULTISPECIES: NAD(P)-dependent oxidoreductase [unclassified Crossiella]MCK2241327.1 NAD(P)-dependent oxidoreductase [Crossiella sp. S99.2]MCK2253529.1 NAD(P)-dependent oxidoreductase [Crossiella sp. S99.1]
MSANGSAVVLGGTGFAGRHVCAELRRRGFDVVVVARKPPDYEPPGRFLALDLGQSPAEELARELEVIGPRVIVNAAGSSWGRTEEQMWAAVAPPTFRLLDALALLAERPRLVQLGSVLEYGQVQAGTTVGAGTVARPTGAYGMAKLATTQAVLSQTRTGRLAGMVLRIANLAGPGSPEVSLLGRVARLLLGAQGQRAVIELDPLLAHRDYVDVRDVADAVAAAALSPVSGRLVDIGRGQSFPVRTLVEMLITCSGLPAVIVERPGSAIRHSTEEWSQVDIEPAERLLGWRPHRSLTEAVEAFWHEFVQRQGKTNAKWSAV